MTNNQINYAKLKEDKRHNQMSEGIELHKAGSSRIQALTNMHALGETATHNRATEQLGKDQLAESIRHNSAEETTKAGTLSESIRSNRVREGETERSNRANEYLKKYDIDTNARIGSANAQANLTHAEAALRSAEASQSQAVTAAKAQENNYRVNLGKNVETNRHNLVTEAENARHSYATEKETKESRLSNYAIGQANVDNAKDRNQIERAKVWGNLATSIMRVGGLF